MTDPPDWDLRSAELARAAIQDGRPTSWFDELYSAGTRGEIGMPWDRPAPLPLVTGYFAAHPLEPGSRAIVIGCGLGVDAEYLAGLAAKSGSSVTAFDISETAIEFVRTRYPSSTVDYREANLLELPAEWGGAFDLVLEVINVQALPLSLRPQAIAAVASLVAPNGRLVVVENVRADDAPLSERPPWPFSRDEIVSYGAGGLSELSIDKVPSATTGPGAISLRWFAVFQRS
ncbi:MAG: class I SAM-dependent methyltransferase [Nakamurella sp.]